MELKKENPQNRKVQQYFDHIAPSYAQRYHATDHPYYCYFFGERLREAVRGFVFEGKKILDIGAGTGALYDFIQANTATFQYIGTDLSPTMLRESHIPVANQRIGSLPDLEMPARSFDGIFMLGVTTYMSRADLETHLAALQTLLAPDGRAVLSFTHRCSLDFHVRRLFRILHFSKLVKPTKSRVIGQSFATMAYCKTDIEQMLERHGFAIQRLEWMNQTVTPFNHLLPGASVRMARWLKRVPSGRVLPFLSGDLLVVAGKKG